VQIRLGTRSSALAQWQADWVTAQLVSLGVDVQQVPIKTEGDVATGPLGQIGGQGLFTKEIQRALLDDRIDLAVHSLKDLPTDVVPGLMLAAIPEREANGDVLVSGKNYTVETLPKGAKIGTGSTRRAAQLLNVRSDLNVTDIRGNVDTRLRKLDEGQFDAIVLAEAGLRRLEFSDRIKVIIPRSIMLGAVGQGALGLETRDDDQATSEMLAKLDHAPSHSSVVAERTLLATLRGGCLAPVGAWARLDNDELLLDAIVLSPDGQQKVTTSERGPQADTAEIGRRAAETLIAAGARELIDSARSS